MKKRVATKILFGILAACLLFCRCSTTKSPGNTVVPDIRNKSAQDNGAEYTGWFYTGNLELLYNRFSKEMQTALPLENLQVFKAQVQTQIGEETALLSEEVTTYQAFFIYKRISRFSVIQSPIIVQFVLDNTGIIQGFNIVPVQTAATTPYLDYKTRTILELPFEGEWFVFWGGRTIGDNYHAAALDQRFAYDFIIMQADRSYKNNGKENSDYYCFGKKLFAPGAGDVIAVTTSVPDNEPGVMNANELMGNYVIINHNNGEYSFLAHFKQDSIIVKAGDRVQKGDFLGLCGNSGNSSEAHLHYHIQNTPESGKGMGLPAIFKDYYAGEVYNESGEPLKNQVVRKK